MSKLYTLNTESVFKINYDSNRYKEIENYKKEIKILVQKNALFNKKAKKLNKTLVTKANLVTEIGDQIGQRNFV